RPARRIVSEDSAAAPVLPREPAIKSTAPTEPLCASGARRERRKNSLLSDSSVISKGDSILFNRRRGVPIDATARFPSAHVAFAIFGAVIVTVRSGRTYGPIGCGESDDKPDGMSTETIFVKPKLPQ